MAELFGGIEAGGTKFVCAVGSGPDDVRAETRFATTDPEETISEAIAFFRQQQEAHGRLQGLGIAAFGPVDPDPRSPTFGYITSTPKERWRNTEFAGVARRALNIPVGFDTDVNGAALGEWRWGAAQGLDTFIYLTVGTGIGGGGMVNGHLLHGLLHPEMGHILIPHDWDEDPYPGHCPYHGDCLEGMASGPAIGDRWEQAADTLPPEHPAWELQATYLSYALVNFLLTLSPQRIILGGGVMQQRQLFPMIRQTTRELLNGYVQKAAIMEEIDSYIVPPQLGGRAGVLGALALAERASSA
ncbi:MAG TPA: ROK family protein [Candidatus Sulfomarinibacteraceae bacterium]|nr:ROK family protein [Candidatus Sulfomarinibacteraceae bacterium]